MKKESAKRGYMTQEEISGHLKSLSSSGGKIGYLHQVLDRKRLLTAETQKNVRKFLAKTYQEDSKPVEAGEILMDLGGEEYSKGLKILEETQDEKAADILEKHGEIKAAAQVYSSIYHRFKDWKGEEETSKKALVKAIELYEKTDEFETAGWLTLNTYEGLYTSSNEEKLKYAALLERVADKAPHDSHKLSFLRGAKERYERMGKGVKAVSIGKKLGALEEKLTNERSRRGYAIIGTAGVLGGLFFISSNITGNAIANMTNSTSSFLGAGLLIIGLIAGLFWIKNKNKK